MCPRPDRSVEVTETAADMVELLLEYDADETEENSNGKTPADLAEVGHLVDTPPAYDEQSGLTRGRLLLLNAPREKAWRRRKLLVLCRTHPNRVRLALQDARREINWLLAGRSPDEANSLGEWFGLTLREERNWRKSRRIGASRTLKGALARLMDLEEEELFRKIVGYL